MPKHRKMFRQVPWLYLTTVPSYLHLSLHASIITTLHPFYPHHPQTKTYFKKGCKPASSLICSCSWAQSFCKALISTVKEPDDRSVSPPPPTRPRLAQILLFYSLYSLLTSKFFTVNFVFWLVFDKFVNVVSRTWCWYTTKNNC